MNTPDDIKRYLYKLDQGTLSPIEREALLEQLRTIAATQDEDALLALDLSALISLGAAHAPLSSDEANALFERVTKPHAPSSTSRHQASTRLWFKRHMMSRHLAAAAVAAAALCMIWIWWRASPHALEPIDPTIKSAQAQLAPSLQVILGAQNDGQALILRTLEPQARVSQSQHLLFRYRLSQPAWLALSVHPQGGPPELLWQSEGPHQAGDFELNANNQALSLALKAYPPGKLVIRLWAAPSKQPWAETVHGLHCAACSSDQLVLKVSP